MLTGENGILTQANSSKEKTEIAEAKEQAKLDIMAWRTEELAKGNDATVDDATVKSIITGKDYVNTLGETSFTTENGYEILYSELYSEKSTGGTTVDGVTIPEGFYYAGGTKDTGLVISDVDGDDLDNTAGGNQFVWVPVENIDDFHTIEGYWQGSLQCMLSDCSEPYTNGYSTEVAEYNAMKQSVEDNKGFYIGRFEAGKDDEGNVVVKKGATVYNNIKWGNSATDETGGAVELAKKFDTENGYTSVTSTLVYGVQWDATMQFFDSNYINEECESTSYIVDSTDKGNYSGSLINTGSNDNYAVKNIYDMAGNVFEWTMEDCETFYLHRVYRGGCYYNTDSGYPASYRSSSDPFYGDSYVGFRLALYLKD